MKLCYYYQEENQQWRHYHLKWFIFIVLSKTYCCFWITIALLCYFTISMSLALLIVYFTYAISKWGTIFKYYFFSVIKIYYWVCCCWWYLCDWYCFFKKFVCITITTGYSTEVLKLIWLLALHVPRESSFISVQFFVLILSSWFGGLFNKWLIFWYSIIILLF